MPKKPSGRDRAAQLNPIISTISGRDTLTNCALMVDQLGDFLSHDQGAGSHATTYLFTAAISAAILFEVEASHV